MRGNHLAYTATQGINGIRKASPDMEMVIFYTTFTPMGATYRILFTLADTTSIHVGAMYLYARVFCTLAHTTSIPVGAMYSHAKTF